MTDRLDADGTALVLRRAFELAHVEPEPDLVIGRQTLAEIAKEVDLPLSAVAAALAERLLRVDMPAGLLERLIGPSVVSTQRASTVSEDEMRKRALDWFQSAHGLRPRLQVNGVVVASKRRDPVGQVARVVREAQGLGRLGKLRRIELVAVDVGDQPGAVCVAADVSDRRQAAIVGGAGVGVGSAALIGVGAVALSPVVLLALPFAAGVGVLTTRVVHASSVRDVRDDLDEALDRIGRGDRPPRPLGSVTQQLTKRLRKRS